MAGLASSSAACFSCILTRSLVRPSTKAAAQGAAIGARFYSEDAGGQSDGQGSGAVTREDGTNGPQKVQMGSEGRPLRRKPRQKAWYKGKLWAQHDELDTRRLISELEELRNYTPIDETVLLKAKKRRFRITAERLALERAKQEALEANRQLWEARRAEMRHNPDIVNDEFKTHQLQFDDQKFNIMHERPGWAAHREAMKKEFPDGWNPPRKVERSEMNVIRRLREMDPERWTTPALADRFKISPEAVRRILKSKYQTEEEKEEAEVGDRLLREVELGSYDTSKTARSSFSTRTTHLQGGQHDPEDEDAAEERYAERTRAPVEPLQEGYRSPILHKWEGGRTSRYANAERWENEPIGHEKREGYRIQRDHRVAGPPILQENRRRRTGNFE